MEIPMPKLMLLVILLILRCQWETGTEMDFNPSVLMLLIMNYKIYSTRFLNVIFWERFHLLPVLLRIKSHILRNLRL